MKKKTVKISSFKKLLRLKHIKVTNKKLRKLLYGKSHLKKVKTKTILKYLKNEKF